MSPFLSSMRDPLDSAGRDRRGALRREMTWSWIAIAITLGALGGFAVETAIRLEAAAAAARWNGAAEVLLARSVIGFLLFSALVYQLTRLGYLVRFAKHRPAPAHALAQSFREGAPRLAILVPSYMEEPPIIRQTLLAAALQQSPNRSVVLLIDDPPGPRDPVAAERLAAARALPREIDALLFPPRRRCLQAQSDFLLRRMAGDVDPAAEAARLAALWDEAASFLEGLAAGMECRGHNESLFVERILRAPARSHRRRAGAWRAATDPAPDDLLLEYRRLVSLFEVEVSSFERKRYANLPHAPNKAMNLNAYLSLMGRRFHERLSPEGRLLEESDPRWASLDVPAADFVIVLDADSLIVPEYSLRLIHFMTRPGHERVAVVQTPYTSVPGAEAAVERVAGATTDVQLMSHQGATRFGAGSWVGASALIRRAALEDIVATQEERGHLVAAYVRDRTLTEDTDTTVALIRKGWRVHNYPDRLAYSATPADFGALLIQRRRWATGGLIILADLWRYLSERPTFDRLIEALIRSQYILGAPVGSLGCAALIVCPFAGDAAWTAWTVPAFGAWLVTYARDLMHNGNRATDFLRTFALNAMLLPINLAGTFNSIGQLCTGRKIPFQRTPKVRDRTSAPPLHVAAQLGLLIFTGAEALASLEAADWPAFAFYGAYAACFAYALHVFIGWSAAIEDLAAAVGPRRPAWTEHLRQAPSTAGRKALREG